jgi:hypothetical protein
LRGAAGSWLVRQLAPLVSLRRLVSARTALAALGPFLSALVARNRWLLARPAAPATGLTPPAGVRSSRAGCSGSCHSDRLVLGSSGSSRRWSRSVLVSASPALAALGPFLSARVTRTGWYSARPVARATGLAPCWSPLCAFVARSSRVHLLHDSVSWWLVRRSRAALVSAGHSFSGGSVPHAHEFHWNSAALDSSTLLVI